MNKKKHLVALLTLSAFCASCGNASEVASSSVPNDIDEYWETIQNQASPNGYYRLQDGWYEGESARTIQTGLPFSYRYNTLKEKVLFQIEWAKEEIKVTEPNGKIVAMEAQYQYTESGGGSGEEQSQILRTISMKDGTFSIEQVTIQIQDSTQTTDSKTYYGECDGLNFRCPWDETYLEPDLEGADCHFSDDSDVLKIQKDTTSDVLNESSLTTFRFLPDLMAVKAITCKEKSSRVRETHPTLGPLRTIEEVNYYFSLREEGPNIEVKKEGQELQAYPWVWTFFASNYFPTFIA